MSQSKIEKQRAKGGVQEDCLKISFQFYAAHSKYCLSLWPQGAIQPALQELRALCLKYPFELNASAGNPHAFHQVVWSSTNEVGGFGISDIENEDVFSIALGRLNDDAARMFGIYLDGTFYIVWFDYGHEVIGWVKKTGKAKKY